MTLDEIQAEGAAAFNAGKTRLANPYPSDSDEHDAWNVGWSGAEQDWNNSLTE